MSQKFYYGRVERIVNDKVGFKLCLVDLRDGVFRWFDYPTHLANAVRGLIGRIEAERVEQELFSLPKRRITREVSAEDFEDLLNEADELAERGDENLVADLCSGMMIKKDCLRNFSQAELDGLFREQKRWRATGGIPIEKLPRKTEKKNAYRLRDFDEIEPEEGYFGPFYEEGDFTGDLNKIPDWIRSQYKFLDVQSMQADLNVALRDGDVVKDEITVVFHPEKAEEIKRSRGLCGAGDANAVSSDKSINPELYYS
jgi:hypothetical protein